MIMSHRQSLTSKKIKILITKTIKNDGRFQLIQLCSKNHFIYHFITWLLVNLTYFDRLALLMPFLRDFFSIFSQHKFYFNFFDVYFSIASIVKK